MSTNKQLLDPIGTLCKLVALNFYDSNTKISIHNHVITLHEPDKLQWLIRTYNGDGKENISELYYVITKLILWFLIDDPEEINIFSNNNKIRQSDEIKRMIEYLCDAFIKLQSITYKHGNVVLVLQYYVNILRAALDSKFNINMLPGHLFDQDKLNDNLLDLEKLKNLWELKDIKRVCELYDNCFLLLNDYEENDENKQSLIQSYLKGIDSILKITDEKFQKLIKNNNNG